jgi:hypothetical protein
MSKRIAVGFLAVLFLAGYLLAEVSGNKKHVCKASGDKTAGVSSVKKECPLEKQVASCLQLSSQEVVLVSQYAAGRAQSAEVKEFAQSLTQDHTQLVSQLQRFSPQPFSTEALAQLVSEVCSGHQSEGYSPSRWTAGRNASGKTSDTPATRVERPTAPADQSPGTMGSGWDNSQSSSRSTGGSHYMGGHHRMMNTPSISGENPNFSQVYSNIERNVVANCICLTQTTFAQLPNGRFDRAFLNQQIGAHIGIIAKLRAVKPYVSGDLKTLVNSAEKTALGHLDRANSILKNWDDKTAMTPSNTSNY